MDTDKFALHILLETKKFATLYVNVNAGRYGEGVCPE
jgi:hypothetical protein